MVIGPSRLQHAVRRDPGFEPASTRPDSAPRKGKARATDTDSVVLDEPVIERTRGPRVDMASNGLAAAAPAQALTRSEIMSMLVEIDRPDTTNETFLRARRQIVLADSIGDSEAVITLINAFLNANRPGPADFIVDTVKMALRTASKRGASEESIALIVEAPLLPLVNVHEWEAVEALLRLVDRYQVSSRKATLALMCLLNHLARPKKALRMFEALENPTAAHYDEAIQAHLSLRDLDSAQKLLAQKLETHTDRTVTSYINLIKAFSKVGGNLAIEERALTSALPSELGQGRAMRQDIRVLNAIMAARGERSDLPGALSVLKHMHFPTKSEWPEPIQKRIEIDSESFRPMPDLSTRAIIMNILTGMDQPRYALEVFLLAIKHNKRGLSPQLVAAAAKALLVNERLRHARPPLGEFEAETFLRELRTGTATIMQQPVPIIFSGVQTGYLVLMQQVLQRYDLATGFELMNRIKAVNAKLGIKVLTPPGLANTLADHVLATAAPGEQGAMSKLAERVRSGFLPSTKSLNTMLGKNLERRNQIRRKRPARIDEILRQAEVAKRTASVAQSLTERGVTMDSKTMSLILQELNSSASPSEMWDLIQVRLIDRGFRPTVHHFAEIMHAHVRDGDIDGARQTIEKAYAIGQSPHIALYTVLISAAARCKRFDVVRDAIAAVKNHDLDRDRPYFSAVAYACARRGDLTGMREVFDEAERELGLTDLDTEDNIFVTVKYRGLLQEGLFVLAQQSISEALNRGQLQPDGVLLRSLDTTHAYINWKLNRLTKMPQLDRQGGFREELLQAQEILEGNRQRVSTHLLAEQGRRDAAALLSAKALLAHDKQRRRKLK